MLYSEKQDQIMNVALALFAENGFDKASVRDIALKAGVNVAMISYYFGSKEKLLEAIFISHFRETRDMLEKVLRNEELSAIDKVSNLIDLYLLSFTKRKAFYQLVHRESIQNKKGVIKALIIDMKTKNRSLVQAAVKSGQKQGVFPKGIEVPILSAMLFGSVFQLISNHDFLCKIYDVKEDDEEAFERVVVEKFRVHIKKMFSAYLTYEL